MRTTPLAHVSTTPGFASGSFRSLYPRIDEATLLLAIASFSAHLKARRFLSKRVASSQPHKFPDLALAIESIFGRIASEGYPTARRPPFFLSEKAPIDEVVGFHSRPRIPQFCQTNRRFIHFYCSFKAAMQQQYDKDAYEDLDEYEDEEEDDLEEEEEQEEDEEYEEEEQPEITKEQLEYLELRQKIKETYRKQLKKENGSAVAKPQENRKKLPYDDNYGSFFGPSQPVIAPRVIQESKSFLETAHLGPKVSNSSQNNVKSSASINGGSKPGVHQRPPKVVNELKVKVQKLKDTRDYSFLMSDDAELQPSTKEPSRPNVFVPKSEARPAHVPLKSKQPMSNAGRQVVNGRDERKPISINGQMRMQSGSNKMASATKPKLASVDPRKQLGSNTANGPGRPMVPKGGLPSKKLGVGERKAPTPPMKKPMHGANRPLPSKLNSSNSKQQMQQKKAVQEPNRAKMVAKQPPMASSRPQMKKPMRPISHSLQDQRPKKKPALDVRSMVRSIMRYNPGNYNSDDDDSDMEAGFEDIQREEKRSAKIARMEDEEEARKIEEEEKQERMRKAARKRKLAQR